LSAGITNHFLELSGAPRPRRESPRGQREADEKRKKEAEQKQQQIPVVSQSALLQ
jgi:hypothetical protein